MHQFNSLFFEYMLCLFTQSIGRRQVLASRMCCMYTSNELSISWQLSLCRCSITDSTLVSLVVPALVSKVVKTCWVFFRIFSRTVFQARHRRASYTSLWILSVLSYNQHSVTAWDYPSAITSNHAARSFRPMFWNRLPMVTMKLNTMWKSPMCRTSSLNNWRYFQVNPITST